MGRRFARLIFLEYDTSSTRNQVHPSYPPRTFIFDYPPISTYKTRPVQRSPTILPDIALMTVLLQYSDRV